MQILINITLPLLIGKLPCQNREEQKAKHLVILAGAPVERWIETAVQHKPHIQIQKLELNPEPCDWQLSSLLLMNFTKLVIP